MGDSVVFDDGITQTTQVGPGEYLGVKDLIDKYGPGPFVIKLARDNPETITKAGGPVQMLTIELPDGRKMPMASSWFKKT